MEQLKSRKYDIRRFNGKYEMFFGENIQGKKYTLRGLVDYMKQNHSGNRFYFSDREIRNEVRNEMERREEDKTSNIR